MAKKKDDSVLIQSLDKLREVEYIPSGVPEFDETFHGFARGRITEVWGNPGVGKSYLLAKTMASLKDGKILYIDAEYSLVKERLVELGVDMAKVSYVQDGRLEQVADMIVENVDKYDLIILDSLPKLVPMTVSESETGSNAIGLFARQVKHFEAKLKPRLAVSKAAFVVINQARAGMGLMQPSKPQGGFAWEHAIDIRIKLFKGANNAVERQKDGVKYSLGHWVSVRADKSRLTNPGITTKFLLEY